MHFDWLEAYRMLIADFDSVHSAEENISKILWYENSVDSIREDDDDDLYNAIEIVIVEASIATSWVRKLTESWCDGFTEPFILS